ILDEPTTGLDPNQLVEIRNLIKEIGQAKTVMLSTHIMQEVELLCNRVIIINNGKIVTDSSTKVLTELLDDRVFIVEFDKTTTASQLKKLEGIRLAEDQGDGRKWQLTALKEHDIRNTVFKYAVSQEMVVLELRQKDQKLENVFQKLTQKHEA
ncbi:MAG TPA: gliding motility-associated ABC transporter ATP-binding subunit GldA, partial [Cryomorphaceae bacterium]|nr:gliding motility-associated ABC transporter ATP-binding subunit GldA [Cryomorphaceae bacterium]